jgi:hypothetical protein
MNTEFITKSARAVGNNKTRSAVVGLNAAALIFLYSNFVPVKQFDALNNQVQKLDERLNKVDVIIAHLQDIHGIPHKKTP